MTRMPKDNGKIIKTAQGETEAEGTYSKITRQVKTEIDWLLENARAEGQEIISKARIEAEEEAGVKSAGILHQSKQNALDIEAEAASGLTQAEIQAMETMDKYLASNTMESKQQIRGNAEKQKGPVAKEIQVEEEWPELFERKVEIVITPPINIARLLRVTRYLGSTPGIRMLQTTGSWHTGCVIGLSLDRPLPLIELLKEMPDVEGVKMLDEQDQSAWPSTLKSLSASHCGQKRISIALKGHHQREEKNL